MLLCQPINSGIDSSSIMGLFFKPLIDETFTHTSKFQHVSARQAFYLHLYFNTNILFFMLFCLKKKKETIKI